MPATGEGLPRFIGGLVGYFGYDTIRYVESRLARCPEIPTRWTTRTSLLLVSEDLVVFDNLAGRLYLITLVDPAVERAYSRAQQRLDDWSELLRSPRSLYAPYRPHPAAQGDRIRFRFHPGRVRERGAANQGIHPGRRLHAGRAVATADRAVPGRPAGSVARALRGLKPSPYMYFLNLGDFHIVGILAGNPGAAGGWTADRLAPIAGTCWRGATEEQDQALEADLLADPWGNWPSI